MIGQFSLLEAHWVPIHNNWMVLPKLSRVRVRPEIASQVIARTFGGALDFQIPSKGKDTELAPTKAEKKEATEKEPSTDPSHTLWSTPSSGM